MIEKNQIYNLNCVLGMKEKIDDKIVDLIITDPPFAIDFKAQKANYNRDIDKVLEGYRETESSEYEEFTLSWLKEAKRILKDTGSMYVFSGWNHLEFLLKSLRILDFKTINHIIWKYSFGVNCSKKFISSHYHILYVAQNPKKIKFFKNSRFKKGEKDQYGREKRYIDMEDVWIINKENWTNKIKTPTKLPREVVKKILSYSSEEGDLVCDPFSGSGQVPWFCKKMNRDFIGFEISKEIFEFSKKRLDEDRYFISNKNDKKGE